MKNIVDKTIKQHNLLDGKKTVVVGFSGGADSVCLLHFLHKNRDFYGIDVVACHLNHLIRGQEAYRDQSFVESFCKEHNIKLTIKTLDIPKIATEQKISFELCGREQRYKFFSDTAKEYDALIATAHTASDNCETLIYNITRGCGISGLCAIPYRRDNIIRPLLDVTRQQIEAYCKENNLSYITDSTNLTDEYTRNKIRHNVIPVLQDINSDFTTSVTRLCENMSEISDFLKDYSHSELQKAKLSYGYDCEKLKKMPVAVLKTALISLLSEYGIDYEQTHINLCVDIILSGGEVCLKNGFKAVAMQNVFRILGASQFDVLQKDFEITLQNTEEFSFNNNIYLVKKITIDKNVHKKFLNNVISCDIINADTVIRTRREGDFFTLNNRNVTKTLKKLFNELKIPKEKRNEILVVANKSEVLWIQGIGTSKTAAITDNIKSGIKIIRG